MFNKYLHDLASAYLSRLILYRHPHETQATDKQSLGYAMFINVKEKVEMV
jgi:hypothetical protein